MRVVFAGLLIAVLALPAAAQTSGAQQSSPTNPVVLNEVYACAQISDEHQRLQCYDNAVGRLREAQTRGDVVAVDRQQAERVNREAFGFSLPSLGNLFGGGGPSRIRTEDIAEISAHITRISQDRSGHATFTLDNGQQWEQIDDENPRNARNGGDVRIRRAMMGSFLMHVEAGGPAIRVRRVQ